MLPAARTEAVDLTVPLDSFLDRTGQQFSTLQGFEVGGTLYTFASIYDTGASVYTLSYLEQTIAGLPIKNPAGASADAIGGVLVGDVSGPVNTYVSGMANADFYIDIDNFDFGYQFIDVNQSLNVPGVQVFVGTPTSDFLPTITGTPVHATGKAALIDMDAAAIDLGDLLGELGPGYDGIVIPFPDIAFVDSGTQLGSGDGGFVTDAFHIPVRHLGANNYADPGNNITGLPNPVIDGITLEKTVDEVVSTTNESTLLFDTGAQLSVISSRLRDELGLDPDSPEFSLTVQGAAGITEVPGYTVDKLTVPHADGVIEFTDVPVFVLDIIDEIDGIFGSNLFNTTEDFLYDPYADGGPELAIRFNTDPDRGLGDLEDLGLLPEEQATVDALLQDPAIGQLVGTGDGLPILPGIEFWEFELGDFDLDLQLDADDIDMLFDKIGIADERFDLNGDGSVDREDARTFVEDILATKFGDANLDGVVDFDDLHSLGENYRENEGELGWANGDFSGDGRVTLIDLDILGRNFDFTGVSQEAYSAEVQLALTGQVSTGQIPEPNTATLLVTAFFALLAWRRRAA